MSGNEGSAWQRSCLLRISGKLSPHLRLHRASGPVPKSMNRESQARFVAVLLFLLTVAAVVFAGFNFQKESEIRRP